MVGTHHGNSKPLPTWNPYNLKYKGEAMTAEGKTVTTGGRTGGSECKLGSDQSGTPRRVSTSGIRILKQPISGVGTIHQRYPIMPLHEEGNNIYKELEALKVLEPERYAERKVSNQSPKRPYIGADFMITFGGFHDEIWSVS